MMVKPTRHNSETVQNLNIPVHLRTAPTKTMSPAVIFAIRLASFAFKSNFFLLSRVQNFTDTQRNDTAVLYGYAVQIRLEVYPVEMP